MLAPGSCRPAVGHADYVLAYWFLVGNKEIDHFGIIPPYSLLRTSRSEQVGVWGSCCSNFGIYHFRLYDIDETLSPKP